MAQCSASHILVETQEQCLALKEEIEAGAAFEDMAKEHSQCPSGQQGGDLGSFGPGMMVPEFDEVCFRDEINTVHGPIQTQFGYHLIVITDRQD